MFIVFFWMVIYFLESKLFTVLPFRAFPAAIQSGCDWSQLVCPFASSVHSPLGVLYSDSGSKQKHARLGLIINNRRAFERFLLTSSSIPSERDGSRTGSWPAVTIRAGTRTWWTKWELHLVKNGTALHPMCHPGSECRPCTDLGFGARRRPLHVRLHGSIPVQWFPEGPQTRRSWLRWEAKLWVLPFTWSLGPCNSWCRTAGQPRLAWRSGGCPPAVPLTGHLQHTDTKSALEWLFIRK